MQIGDRPNQRYTLSAHFGSGAMGDVFLAVDIRTNETVAGKALDRPAEPERRTNSPIPCYPDGVRPSAGATSFRP